MCQKDGVLAHVVPNNALWRQPLAFNYGLRNGDWTDPLSSPRARVNTNLTSRALQAMVAPKTYAATWQPNTTYGALEFKAPRHDEG